MRRNHLKLPSTPDTSIALIIILVSLKGTCSTQTNQHSLSTLCTATLHHLNRLFCRSTPGQRKIRTLSGNFSRCMEASKQSPKSMCSSLPLYLSSMRLLGCLSPKPSKYPTCRRTIF